MSLSSPARPTEPTERRPSPPPHGRLRRLAWGLRVAQVRLRFPIVLVAAFLIVGKWHVLRNAWDTWIAPAHPTARGVSSDTEYFCPMCPGVISDWPSKCSVCNMPLVRRKRGEAVHLPDGVVARMQLSPYRVQLAGIRTAALEYRPLVYEVVADGKVAQRENGEQRNDGDRTSVVVNAEIHEDEIPYVVVGATAAATSDMHVGHDPWPGRVSAMEHEVAPRSRRVKIQITVDDPREELWPGMNVSVRMARPVDELEPFCSQPAGPPPLAKGELRKLYTCLDHPHVLRENRGTCPEDKSSLVERRLTELERVTWWCPMHPTVTALEPGQVCDECGGMKLVPRVLRYRPRGQVLAVPESAVIELGDRRVVYVERMPGMFDGVEVALAPRCGTHYPVIGGLEPGERVAATGAFLLDAETRLNPSVAAGYFGAARATDTSTSSTAPAAATDTSEEEAAAIREALAELSPADRRSVGLQKTCPITGLALGSMGVPLKIEVGGRTVWICCEGCRKKAREMP
ncbi:MAG TPA: heavy metal-binding domain-containing protein [Pirellulales bacterium]|nr:heavy metal-binding domain-containing protein [Pirellulales bacterium]